MDSLRIAFLTPEVAPFAKVGGLADVSAALPRELQRAGHDVRVFMPNYRRLAEGGHASTPVPGLEGIPVRLGTRTFAFSVRQAKLPGSELAIHLIDCPELYDRPGVYTQDPDEHLRFVLLTHAALLSCQRMAFAPDVLHANDWQTALAPLYVKSVYAWDRLFRGTRSVFTIHNLGYQGVFGAAIAPELGLGDASHLLHQEDLRAGRIGFLKHGLLFADALTTVSPTYAREIQTDQLGMGLQDVLRRRADALTGILNGVDDTEWNPRTDPLIPQRYSDKSLWRKKANKRALLAALGLPFDEAAPVVGLVTRLTAQKGIELLAGALPALLEQRDFRFTVLGSGEPRYEEPFIRLQQRYPGKVCFYRGYNNELAHLIEAGADMFVMPSLYEPCGLNQLYSLAYGTIPVVRRTGGLADTVEPWNPATGQGTGFVFEHFTPEGLAWALGAALDAWQDRRAWRTLQKNAMTRDFSWRRQAAEYVALYARLAAPQRAQA